ncbi:MAG: hypothetical protein BMS9Abin12_1113 [Acidimicrobiia bacterium]|nr:MAG: hypothetical protein BMS9Abin12_1113 [Acidimicrobiia bacterium]
MTNQYTYDPDAWPPVVAGLVAGAIAAIAAAVIGWILTTTALDSPDEYANSLTVVVIALVLGLISGVLWRRLRASSNAQTVFAWSMAGGFVAAIAAVLLADQTVLTSLAPYAVPLVAIVFITLGFFTPMLARTRSPQWIAAIPPLLAVGIGFGLFL